MRFADDTFAKSRLVPKLQVPFPGIFPEIPVSTKLAQLRLRAEIQPQKPKNQGEEADRLCLEVSLVSIATKETYTRSQVCGGNFRIDEGNERLEVLIDMPETFAETEWRKWMFEVPADRRNLDSAIRVYDAGEEVWNRMDRAIRWRPLDELPNAPRPNP